MKRIIYMSLFLALVCISTISNAVVTNSSEYINVKVYVFYEENNNEYNEEKQWLDENINYRKEYINVNENSELFKKIKEKLKIGKNKTPITIVGSTYFVGFNEEIKNNIKDAITAYDNADEYGDIVEKTKNNEDVKDLIKQNNKIYKQPKKTNIFLVVLIVLALIIIIVFFMKQIKSKNRRKRVRTHSRH